MIAGLIIGYLLGLIVGVFVIGLCASSKLGDLLSMNLKLTAWNQKLRDKLYGGKNG